MHRGSENLPDPVEDYEKSMHLINGGQFKVRSGLRYREERGFWLVHIVGAWITRISPDTADFLKQYEKSQEIFTLEEYPDSKEALADLLTKNIIERIN